MPRGKRNDIEGKEFGNTEHAHHIIMIYVFSMQFTITRYRLTRFLHKICKDPMSILWYRLANTVKRFEAIVKYNTGNQRCH
jgi:hypothetical protein